MGSETVLPAGPFVFASQKDIPVFAVFVMKERGIRYRLIVRRVDNDESRKELSVRGKAALLVKNYAEILERVVEQYPYQWFNYYDFWQDN